MEHTQISRHHSLETLNSEENSILNLLNQNDIYNDDDNSITSDESKNRDEENISDISSENNTNNDYKHNEDYKHNDEHSTQSSVYRPNRRISIKDTNDIIYNDNDTQINTIETGDHEVIKNNNIELPTLRTKTPMETSIKRNINTFWEANSESDESNNDKLSFQKLKNKMNHNYDSDLIHKYSSALDILASYINCYNIIYSEASYHCQYKLNIMMLPCIFLSSLCAVVTAHYKGQHDTLFVSAINGIIAFLLAIINYLKLDASSEAHKISAYQYSKLKNHIEFTSADILLFQNPLLTSNQLNDAFENNDELFQKRQQLEEDMIKNVQTTIVGVRKSLKNIEENNNFILPKHIQDRYFVIRNINVFACIKNVENHKLITLNELRNVKNELRFYKEHKKNQVISEKKILELYEKKNNLINQYFELQNGYNLIDNMLKQELLNIKLYKKYWYLFFIQRLFKFCCSRKFCNILPKKYKSSTKMGSVDEDGNFLLQRVLIV